MKKIKIVLSVLIFLLIFSIGTTTVSADMGPKPASYITIKGIEGEYVACFAAKEAWGPNYDYERWIEYEIDYVKQNGETIYNVELGANNKYTPNETSRAIYIPILDVDKEYSVLVAFRPITYYIEYYFTNDGGDYEQFVYGGDVYRTEGNCATKLGIEEFASLNLKRFDGTQYLALGFTKDSVLNNNWTLYTEASEAELKAVLGLE